MGVCKVDYGDATLIDLTEDTVTAETLVAGTTAHDANGDQIVGILTHETLQGRDSADQHPIGAITGLQEELDEKLEQNDLSGYATESWVQEQGFAKESQIPTVPTNISAFNNDKGYLTSLGADYILEKGTTNGWNWEKWNSGKYICYGNFTDTCTHYTTVGPFYGFYSTQFPYPIVFPEPPIVLFNCKIGNGFGMPAGDVMRSSSAVRCYALSTAKDTVTCVWEMCIIGRWK